jgi:hypothetical protein
VKLSNTFDRGSKSTIIMSILLTAVIIYTAISHQLLFAPPPVMMVDPTLHPENVTASIGNLIMVSFSSGTGMRMPEPDKPTMEVSYVGGGNYRATTNISDFGTVMIESGANGSSTIHGQGMIMDSKGEVVTYRIQGVGNMGADGYFRNHGMIFFNPSSGVFNELSGTVGIFANEVNQKGNAVTKVWELQ